MHNPRLPNILLFDLKCAHVFLSKKENYVVNTFFSISPLPRSWPNAKFLRVLNCFYLSVCPQKPPWSSWWRKGWNKWNKLPNSLIPYFCPWFASRSEWLWLPTQAIHRPWEDHGAEDCSGVSSEDAGEDWRLGIHMKGYYSQIFLMQHVKLLLFYFIFHYFF